MAQDPDEVVISATPPASGRNTDQIRAQIEETRADMSETIDAIQERLSPSRLVTRARDRVTEASSEGVQMLSQRPVAAAAVAVMGLGATWLLGRAVARRARNRRYHYAASYHTNRHTAGLLIGAAAGACWATWMARS